MLLEKGLLLLAAAGAVAAKKNENQGYVPTTVSCSDDIELVRMATGLSESEQEWLEKRKPHTDEALRDFLSRSFRNFTNSDTVLNNLFGTNSSTNAPKLAVAFSGGGYRAMLSGAGMLSAMDNRTDGANEHGLGGLLQSATYLAGLSGGNWLTSTLAWNNWTSVQDIVNNMTADDSIWDISNSIINVGGINIFHTAKRWDHISDAVKAKQKAGFNVSLADVWGRALSYNFWPSLYRGGLDYQWSQLRDADVFANGEMPMPISVADGRYPGTKVIDLNATLFEFNPFEMGSWDPTLNAFSDVKYLGTNVSNGKPVEQGKCVVKYDNTGFITATSSTLFNQFLLRLNDTKVPSFIKDLARHFLNDLSSDYDDIAIYSPNPFRGAETLDANQTTGIVSSRDLFLVDGGEDGQNIPLVPLLQRERDLDVIFAMDNSADTADSWPDGASLVHTYRRQFGNQGVNVSFPYVPGQNTFVNLELNKKPTFFGCDAGNLTDLHSIPPLIVYIPNAEYSYHSNQSTFKMSYSTNQRLNMIKNGFEAASRGNLTDDPNFAGCVGCAILRRKQQALNLTLPRECERCFTQYCWNGTVDNSTPQVGSNNDYNSAFAEAAFASQASSESREMASSTASNTKHKNAASRVGPAQWLQGANSGLLSMGLAAFFAALL